MDIINYEENVSDIKIDLDNTDNKWLIVDNRLQIERDLTQLQRDWFEERNFNKKHKIWNEMFLHVQKYAKSLILKRIKGGKFVDPDIIEDQSNQVALTFMSQYLYRPEFYVGVSFAGMMSGKILEALYKHLQDDDVYSLNETLGDSEHEFEDIQGMGNMEALFGEIPTPEEVFERTELKEVLNTLLKEFDALIEEESIRFKLRCYLLILLRKPRNKHILPIFFRLRCNKKEMDLLQLFELELFERLRNA